MCTCSCTCSFSFQVPFAWKSEEILCSRAKSEQSRCGKHFSWQLVVSCELEGFLHFLFSAVLELVSTDSVFLRCLSSSSFCCRYDLRRLNAAIAGVAAAPLCKVCRRWSLAFLFFLMGTCFASNICHLSVLQLFWNVRNPLKCEGLAATKQSTKGWHQRVREPRTGGRVQGRGVGGSWRDCSVFCLLQSCYCSPISLLPHVRTSRAATLGVGLLEEQQWANNKPPG